MRISQRWLSLSLFCVVAGVAGARDFVPRALDWEDLIPENARKSYEPGPPPPTHGYLGAETGLAARQPMNFAVNKKLAGLMVRIPGFIVPTEIDSDGRLREFFLVPYFGACIHVPPPPPNQMIYVKLWSPVFLQSTFDPYYITGKLTIERADTELGSSAYAMSGQALEPYQ